MIEYPKIQTLYERNAGNSFDPDSGVAKGKVFPDRVRLPEFAAVKAWHITEKVDGTNIRIGVKGSSLDIRGRTNRAQIPTPLLMWINENVPHADKLLENFGTWEFVLFGEGYGGKIQRGGKYADHERFVLFDVWVDGWWLERPNVEDVADALGLDVVPTQGIRVTREEIDLPNSPDDLRNYLPPNCLTDDPEGIVARSVPQMFDRRGNRVMWKLKFKDFAE